MSVELDFSITAEISLAKVTQKLNSNTRRENGML